MTGTPSEKLLDHDGGERCVKSLSILAELDDCLRAAESAVETGGEPCDP